MTLATSGCPADNHVGRPCEVGTQPLGGSSGQIVTLAAPALECPSRICLLPGADYGARGTGALCTAPCESDNERARLAFRVTAELHVDATLDCYGRVGNMAPPFGL